MALSGWCILTICTLYLPTYNTMQRFTNHTIHKGLMGCNLQTFCSASISNPLHTGVNRTCCSRCSCTEDCWLFGDCCPDVLELTTPSRFDETMHVCYPNVIDIVNKGTELPLTKYFRMITKCPSDSELIDNKTKQHCEDPFGEHFSRYDFSMKDVVPVSDHNNYIFRNAHCAKCHGITSVIQWIPFAAFCAISNNEMLQSVDNLQTILDVCNLYAVPPDGVDISRSYCFNELISTCGDSVSNDMKRACQFSTFPVKRQWHFGHIYYKNIFCLLCNEPDAKMPTPCFGTIFSINILSTMSRVIAIDTNSAVMEVTSDNSSKSGGCSKQQIYDHNMGICRNLMCQFPFFNPEYGTCIRSGYQWYGWSLMILIHINLENADVSHVSYKDGRASNIVQSFMKIIGLSDICQTCEKHTIYSGHTERSLFIKLGILMSPRCSYEIINETITYFRTITIRSSLRLSHNTFTDISYRLFPLLNANSSLFVFEECLGFEMTKLYHCPYILLNETEYCRWQEHHTLFNNGSCNISLTDFESSSLTAVFLENGNINIGICANEYLSNVIQSVSTQLYNIEGILSLVCTCVSMLCTAITVVLVWSRANVNSFPMFVLIISMVNHFIAQGLFQFGIGWQDATNVCPVIGAFIHYFWLATVFSLSAYCVSVYHSLRKHNVDVLSRKIITLIVNYIFLLPLVFVATNIIYSVYSSDKESVRGGYGKHQCFIDSNLMRGITFAAPILTAIFVNCAVYLRIVLIMHKHVVQSRSVGIQTRYATSYFRLLVITGFTWLVGYINEIFHNVVLDYVFIICFGCQGVFLLMAFGLKCPQKRTSSTDTQRSTVASFSKERAIPISH